MTEFVPFSISCRVPGGVAATRLEDISLDGPLAYVQCQRDLGEEFWLSENALHEPELPLARRGTGGTWYWAASRAQGAVQEYDVHYWHRRFNADHDRFINFDNRRGKITTEGGPMRDMRVGVSILYPEVLTWYAYGDPAAVREMLQRIRFIGKHPGMGMGRCHWEEPVLLTEDRSVWSDGHLMRPVPAAEVASLPGGHFEFEYRGLRPPYWDPTTQELCAVRGYAEEARRVG